MIKKILLVILIIFSMLQAEDYSMLNLSSPTSLENRQICFSVRHRFYGDIGKEPLKTFFGMDAGANTLLSLRIQPYPNLEIKTSYIRLKKRKSIGLSYTLAPEKLPFLSQIDFEYFAFEESGLQDEKRSNLLGILSLRNRPIGERFTALTNIGYDAYYERPFLGIGALIHLLNGLGSFEQVDLILEYFPVLDRDSAGEKLADYIQPQNAAGIALKLDTYGHRFLLSLTNSSHFHAHRLTLGTADDAFWRFGFNIERILYF